MNPLPILSSLDNGVLAMSAPDFLSFRAHLLSVIRNGITVTPSIGFGPSAQAQGAIARIPVNGLITRGCGLSEDDCSAINVTDLDYTDEYLRDARDNADISAILLPFNTNGGVDVAHPTAALINEIAQVKPIIGFASRILSAGYQLGSQCSELYVAPTAWAGFVGTIYTRVDLTEANKQDGIGYTFVSSSPKKLYLNPNAAITDEELAWIEQAVMFSYNIFRNDVLANRQLSEEALDSTIYIGQQAVDANLADGVVNSEVDLMSALQKI